MHLEAAAQQAVGLMLGSSVFSSSSSGTRTYGSAFFFLRVNEKVSRHYEVKVYALSGSDLIKWPKGSTDYFDAGASVQANELYGNGGIADGKGMIFYTHEKGVCETSQPSAV